ncbi:MAG: hypothetical protein LKI28_04770 [Ancrocorticia sp.]|nr:hypothetical protein [Ancrocorticia sp.]
MSQPPYPTSGTPGDRHMPNQPWDPNAPHAIGYPYGGYTAPQEPGGFASMFSLDFREPLITRIAKPLMVTSIIVGIFNIVFGFVAFLVLVSSSNNPYIGAGGMAVFMGILILVMSLAASFFQIGATRAALDYMVHRSRK